jgi:hypothetical protein
METSSPARGCAVDFDESGCPQDGRRIQESWLSIPRSTLRGPPAGAVDDSPVICAVAACVSIIQSLTVELCPRGLYFAALPLLEPLHQCGICALEIARSGAREPVFRARWLGIIDLGRRC